MEWRAPAANTARRRQPSAPFRNPLICAVRSCILGSEAGPEATQFKAPEDRVGSRPRRTTCQTPLESPGPALCLGRAVAPADPIDLDLVADPLQAAGTGK